MSTAVKQCKCEHWQICQTCMPHMFDKDGTMKSAQVLALGAKRHDLQVLVDEIKAVVLSKPGRPVNFTEALGALEIVKLELFWTMQQEEG